MTPSHLDTIATLVATVLQRPPVPLPPHTSLRHLPGMDSLRFLEIIALAEDHFAREIDTARLESLRTIQDLLDALRLP